MNPPHKQVRDIIKEFRESAERLRLSYYPNSHHHFRMVSLMATEIVKLRASLLEAHNANRLLQQAAALEAAARNYQRTNN